MTHKPPTGWEFVNLGDVIVELKSGLSRQLSNSDIGLPVLRSTNIIGNRVDFSDLKYWYVDDPQGADTRNYYLQKGDILVNFINSIAQIGKCALYSEALPRNVIYTTNLLRLRTNTRTIPEYLLLLTETEDYAEYILSITKPAVNQASFTTVEFKRWSFALPPLAEQRQIAAILSTWDEAITRTTQLIAALQRRKQALMQLLLTGAVRFAEFSNEIWNDIELGDCIVGKPEYGANASAIDYDPTLPRYIRITDITNDGWLSDSGIMSVKFKGNERYILHEKDFLFARSGATVGKTYLYRETDGWAIHAGYLIKVVLNETKLLAEYLRQYTQSDLYTRWINNTIHAGAQPNINAQEYMSLILPLPSIPEQQNIVKVLNNVDQEISIYRDYLLGFATQKRGLMQQLLTGAVRVPLAN